MEPEEIYSPTPRMRRSTLPRVQVDTANLAYSAHAEVYPEWW